MDPLTHVVVGRALTAAAARQDQAQPFSLGAAAILGALSPDIDSVVAFAGWDRYLRVHQLGTHSLLGSMATASLAAGLVRACAPRARFGVLWAAAAAGAVSHVALDLASGARVAVAWPLLNERVSLPLVAMADPWLIGISVAGLLALWPVRLRTREAARLVIVTMSMFLTFKAAMFALALGRSGIRPTAPSAIEARWGSLTEWSVFERSADSIRSLRMSSSGTSGAVVMSKSVPSESSLVEASRALDTVRNFLEAHEFAFPVVEQDGLDHISVLWSDSRYCAPASAPDLVSCDVWAGGVFDRSGRALRQEVKVGGLVQTRRPPG